MDCSKRGEKWSLAGATALVTGGTKGIGDPHRDCCGDPRRDPRSDRRKEKGKKICKHVIWADEIGKDLVKLGGSFERKKRVIPGVGEERDLKGGSINGNLRGILLKHQVASAEGAEEATKHATGKGSSYELRSGVTAGHHDGKKMSLRSPADRRGEGGASYSIFPSRGSFKEALVKPILPHAHPTTQSPKSVQQRSKQTLSPYPVKRCFRCLARDHVVAACRDPVRCRRCLCFGHRASLCRAARGTKTSDHMYRPFQRQGRAPGRTPVSKVFVPYTEEYLRRTDLRRNAVLADVLRPANLGPDPISSIKNALARRFGGYVDDFAVARHRERDYAIFLPEWAPADVLIRREILTLNDFWIRCYPWGQHSNARPHRSRYRAWIRLINLPFEIWNAPRVAAIVGGFGRFVKPDATTKAMTDLRAYRCQIVLDSTHDIPQNLSIVLGDELFSVMVHLESWEVIAEGGGGAPPAPPQEGPEEGEMEGDVDNIHQPGGVGDQPMFAAEDEVDTGVGEVEEAEAPPQSQAARRGLESARRGLEPRRPQGGVGAVALWQPRETNISPLSRRSRGEAATRTAARKAAQGSEGSRSSGGFRRSGRAAGRAVDLRPVMHGTSSTAVPRDGRRRHATVDQGVRLEGRKARSSRLGEKFVGLKVGMENPEAFGYVNPPYLPPPPEKVFREKLGALPEGRPPRAPAALHHAQEWNVLLFLNSQVLLLSAHLHPSGSDRTGPLLALRASLFALSPTHGPPTQVFALLGRGLLPCPTSLDGPTSRATCSHSCSGPSQISTSRAGPPFYLSKSPVGGPLMLGPPTRFALSCSGPPSLLEPPTSSACCKGPASLFLPPACTAPWLPPPPPGSRLPPPLEQPGDFAGGPTTTPYCSGPPPLFLPPCTAPWLPPPPPGSRLAPSLEQPADFAGGPTTTPEAIIFGSSGEFVGRSTAPPLAFHSSSKLPSLNPVGPLDDQSGTVPFGSNETTPPEGPKGPRSCARLSNRTSESALGRAISRKARLREGGSACLGSTQRKWSNHKVKSKAALCGVSISDADAASLRHFLHADAHADA